ncbi:MAG TPA: CHAT domain-containing protein [Kofleriaceae bacterium]|nr:CHAT domain-containing protein [Kofleriaceae bacterium]
MWIVGDGSRIGMRGVLVVVAFSVWPAQSGIQGAACEAAFAARAWGRVASACREPQWGARVRLASAWQAWEQHREGEALTVAEQLLDTNVAADAAYLAGYIRGTRDPSGEPLAHTRLEQALRGFQLAGRHADAARAAESLSRLLQGESRFSDELRLARLAVREAELAEDAQVSGRASASLAEAYDWIGMAGAARESFLRAEQQIAPWPDKLAHIYSKHAAFLLDLGTRSDLETSLRYLDAAANARSAAIARGLGRNVSELGFAIQLDRVDARSQLGQLEAADRELAAARQELGTEPAPIQRARLRLVEGYLAARRDDPATAEAKFTEADDGSLETDYRLRIALELARSHRAAGHLDQAERAYRAAIAIAEQLRGSADVVELRPWVLARRTLPYVELLAMLVEQRRGLDALVVAESLHARAWLDVVLGASADRTPTELDALTAVRIRQRLTTGAVPPRDGASLMAAVGDREALVYLTIGATTWRGHVLHGATVFDRLPADTVARARRFSAAPDDVAASELASTALVPADLSDSRDTLYVIATGALADVPFAALRWRGRRVIDGRPVARIPGLVALRETGSSWDEHMIFVGDSRGDLPEAAREVREIAAAMGGTASVGPAATRQVLTSARGARLLHVAAHGTTTSSGRALVLADGTLTAADVLDAGLDPRVVVLSGCATAASEDAESWDGFPSAFLAAGSRYVVATLRSVEDAAAARVIAAYYAQPATMNPIERLAAAQRQVSAVLPVAAWASFAAWGSEACAGSSGCSIERRRASSPQHASVGADSPASGREPGTLPRGPGAISGGSRRPQRSRPHP